MDIYEEQILEAIRQIKRPDTESIFKLLTTDAAANITMKDTKKNTDIDRDLNYR